LAEEGPILDLQSVSPASIGWADSHRPCALDEVLSASLVGSETNQHPLETQSGAQERIHHAVEKARFLIIDALFSSTDADLQRRSEKMGLCCVAPMIFADADSAPVCVAGYCRDRLCPTCMRRRAFKVRCRLIGLVSSMNSPRFLTLTERDSTEPLKVRLDRMSAAFAKLRRTDVWKRHVKGGVAVWEVKWNPAAGTWHPHLHVLIDGVFFPHAALYAEWVRILGHDGTTDLQACRDRVKSAVYVSKYLAKDTDISRWGARVIQEFATAMHRRRLIATFGSAHRTNLDLCDKEAPKPTLPRASISYGQMMDAIGAGVPAAERAAPLLARLGIAFRQLFFEWAMPGECYADEIPASQMADFGRWIEEVDAHLRCAGEIEEVAPLPPDERTRSLFAPPTGYV
jgi:Replication protein